MNSQARPGKSITPIFQNISNFPKNLSLCLTDKNSPRNENIRLVAPMMPKPLKKSAN